VIVLWPTRWRRPALVAATVYAVGIGLTRLALGVHYLSDVVAGWALATAVVGVTWLALWSWLDLDAARSSASTADGETREPASGRPGRTAGADPPERTPRGA